MDRGPETHYAKADDGVHIAYQVFGSGAFDLVVIPGFISHVELCWEDEALAGPGEVLVSRTVTDLVAGSGLEFEDRGGHELKGVPGRWQVYAARP